MTPLVELRKVSKSFDTSTGSTAVLDGVDLSIRPGEKASLIGPSGSGKSTLLALIAGLLRPTSGTVVIDGTPIDDLDDAKRAALRANRIGIALQSDNLIPFLTASENVELAMAFGPRRTRAERRRQTIELLERFRVDHRAAHYPRHLSGGEAQRVALAVSIANEPDLLVADEIVAQLDGQTAVAVVDEILDAEFALLFVTHDVALADLVESRYALDNHKVTPR